MRWSLYTYRDGKSLNELLHAVSRLLTHLLGHVAVNVQREAGGGVAEISLHGLDIVAALDEDDGVAVAQIVKARRAS